MSSFDPIATTTAGVGRLRRHVVLMAAAMVLATGASGCSSLLGGDNKDAPTIYAPDPQPTPDGSWPQADWQLAIARTEAPRMIDSLRMVVRPQPGEIQVYKGANWARPPSGQIEDIVQRTLEDSGKILGIAPQGSGIAADYRLVMELRRYDADYAGGTSPTAVIEINAKLLRSLNQEVVGSRTFRQAVAADGTDIGQVSQAFGKALATLGHDVAGWVLTTGQTAQTRAAPTPRTLPPTRKPG